MSSVSPSHSVNDDFEHRNQEGFPGIYLPLVSCSVAALIGANQFETNSLSYKLMTSQPRDEHAKKLPGSYYDSMTTVNIIVIKFE